MSHRVVFCLTANQAAALRQLAAGQCDQVKPATLASLTASGLATVGQGVHLTAAGMAASGLVQALALHTNAHSGDVSPPAA